MRALRWAILNQPRGAHFVSHFKGKKDTTSVGIAFDDEGYVVRQRRGTALNGYDTPAGTLAAMRTDVPDEVKQITGLDVINIQTQGDPYFMLNSTPGQVAKELNRLVGLDIIDNTLGRLNRIENEAGGKAKITKEYLDSEEEELDGLSFVDDLETRIVEIETLWGEYNKLLAKKGALSDSIEKIKELDSDIKNTNEWLTIKDPYNELMELVGKRRSLLKDHTQLKKLLSDYREIEKSWQNADSLINQLIKRQDDIKNSKEYQQSFCKYCGAHKNHWRK
jgi:DNA repair exonuclease SbcCD ATPase subunit